MIPTRRAALSGTFCGLIYGALYALAAFLTRSRDNALSAPQLEGLVLIVLMPLAILLLRRLTSEALATRPTVAARFAHYEPWTYCVFLSAGLFLLGLRPSIAYTLALWAVLILSQAAVFVAVHTEEERAALVRSEKYIALLFLISGFSALIYQVVWQRTLFSTFGINSESVTVIVSVFMFGLGVGSLTGGYLQKRFARHLLRLFLILEISIGVFGFFSLELIELVSHFSGNTSTGQLVFWVYLILALPTLLMGATLPILVAWLQGYLRNIGKTIGLLYAFNTIGSAIAAFCTVEVLFVFVGQHTAVLIAATCNFATALLIYKASRQLARGNSAAVGMDVDAGAGAGTGTDACNAACAGTGANTATGIGTGADMHAGADTVVDARTGAGIAAVPDAAAPRSGAPHLPFAFIFVTLAAIGYISLSQEILWFRLLGYMTANRPQVFGLLLAAFLVGVAGGSLESKKICESQRDPYTYLIRALLCAIAVFYLAVPAIAEATALLGKDVGALLAYALIAVVAFLTGGILPMLIHVGTGDKRSNSTEAMSWLYFANIIGATCGPLLTGFILLDRFTLEVNIVILTGITFVLVAVLIAIVPLSGARKLGALAAAGAMGLVGLQTHAAMYDGYLEKMQFASLGHTPFKYKLENLSGILTTEAGHTDIMYGNGIYDGRFNIDALVNDNLIDRTYIAAALHRHPTQVLEIGLSTGSWTKILADYAPLEQLTVVEINKGYPALIAHYPDIAAAFHNPKVQINIDDGRRWLRNHPERRFDLIVMNTSYHWRSNMTNLLSAEFLMQCKRHLNTGGVIYYNTTGSRDIVYTAASVFKHVTTYSNFVAASDAPFDMTAEERRANLLQFRGAGVAQLFDKDDAHRTLLRRLAGADLREVQDAVLGEPSLWRITDDNMAVEYKLR